MKILLVMPNIENVYWKSIGKKIGPNSEPLSLLYIATFLNHNGHKAEILDCIAECTSLKQFEQKVRKGNYNAIGISMLTMMFKQVVTYCKIIKKVSPKTKIIVGGPHPSIQGKNVIKNIKEIDIAVIGEAEISFLELMEAFENKRKLSTIKGIVYHDSKGKVIQTQPRPLIKNLDILPILDRSLINMKLYRPSVSYYKKLPSYIIVTSRGCPYRCTFCSKVFEKQFRIHSTDRVIKEMKLLINKFKAKEIVFRDDTFTLNQAWVAELCHKIIKEGLHKQVKWSCMTRVNLISLELLKLMKQAGCWGIHFGVESGSQRLLDLIKKDVTLEQIRNAFKWTRKVGIETRAFMMLGLPTETRKESLQTIKFAKELNPDWAQFTITTPYPGTKLYEQAKEYSDKGASHNWENYYTWGGFSDHELVWVPKGRTSEELKKLQRRALIEFYFRPKIILRKIIQTNNFPIFKKYVLGALALVNGGSGRVTE